MVLEVRAGIHNFSSVGYGETIELIFCYNTTIFKILNIKISNLIGKNHISC